MDKTHNNNPAEEWLYTKIESGTLINPIFGFACKKCFSRHEAEELTQEILTELIHRVKKNPDISHFYAYVWGVARNVYADHVRERMTRAASTTPISEAVMTTTSFEDNLLSGMVDEQRLIAIRRQIAYLSQIYRDIMVMFYFDELPIKTIAGRLDIPPNRVKQRLFSAKQKIRKEVGNMEKDNKDLTLKPYTLQTNGTGDCSTYGDPRDCADRLLPQNLIIACRDQTRTAEELAKQFNIPTVFIENELQHMAGKMITDLGGGKYISSYIVIDKEARESINKELEYIACDLSNTLKKISIEKRDKLMSLDYLEPPRNYEKLLWFLVPSLYDYIYTPLGDYVREWMRKEGIKKEEKHFYVLCEKLEYGTQPDNHFYSINGLCKDHIEGFKEIHFLNYIGKRLPWECGRFGAGGSYPLEFGDLRRFLYQTMGGLNGNDLDECEKELAAQAIAKGYVRKDGEWLYPDIPVMDKATEKAIYAILEDIKPTAIEEALSRLSIAMIALIKKTIPKHLLGQSDIFACLMTSVMPHLLIEACLKNKLLPLPDYNRCNEGIWMVIEK